MTQTRSRCRFQTPLACFPQFWNFAESDAAARLGSAESRRPANSISKSSPHAWLLFETSGGHLLELRWFRNRNGIIIILSLFSVWFLSNKMTQFSLMLHITFPLFQLVEKKLSVWLLYFARTDARSKQDWETRFLRTSGWAVNFSSITCFGSFF